MKSEKYYNDKYFNDYQKQIGLFGGKANLFKFEKYISNGSTVLDFGCGGGFLLNNLKCKNKVGVEINPVARNFCNSELGIKCFAKLSEVKNKSIDVIISNHALEHCEQPLNLIKELKNKLKKSGQIIIVVPLDSFKYKYNADDVNKHLYSFSPMNLGNLLENAGFKKITSGNILHKWPPFWKEIQKIFGWSIFHLLCRLYGVLNLYWTQTIGIGTNEN
tara:strand:+ start:26703 stop:27356 length:654 start_codon:yes stop_codon:yes gene_type:complete